MAHKTRRALGALLLSLCGLSAVLSPSAKAAGTKPIILVFPGTVNPTGGGVSERKGDDDITPDRRTRAGVLAFSSCLVDSGAFLVVRYDPELSMIKRAEMENHITVAHPEDPTPNERLNIAKGMGALYEVTVTTIQPPNPAPKTSTVEMSIDGVEVSSHKGYTDHIQMSSNMVAMRGAATADGDFSNALRHFSGNDRLDNVLQSAANTLVIKLLGGPLHEFASMAAPPGLTPSPVGQAPTSPDVILPTPPAHRAEQANPPSGEAPTPTTPATPTPATVTPATPAPTPVPPATPAPATPEPAAPIPATTPAPVTTPTPAPTVEQNPRLTPPPTPVAPTNLTTAPAPSAPANTPVANPVPEKLVLPPVSGGSSVYDAAGKNFATPDDEAREAIRQSNALLSDGDANEAIMMLRQEIDRQPLSPALRTALAKTYLNSGRSDEAESEARRALIVLPTISPTALGDLTGLLTQAISSSDSVVKARTTYEKIVAERPDATWARNALAQLDINEGRSDEAETEYRTVLKTEPTNIVAARGLAILHLQHGDLPGAEAILAGLGTGNDANAARYEVIKTIFDAGTTEIAGHIAQNRAAWEAKSLSNEIIFNATNSQSDRINNLLTLLQSVTPAAAGRPESEARAFYRRKYAGTLLNQAAAAQIHLIQKGDADAASEVTLDLTEFQQALAQAQGK